MQKHTYKRYDKELNKLKDQVSNMGEQVSMQLDLLLASHQQKSDEQLEEIVDNDVAINGMETKASKTVIKLLAKRAPMGKDLRMIIASSRTVTELERIGDEIVSMAKAIKNNDQIHVCEDDQASVTLESLIVTAMNLLDRALLAARNDDDSAASVLIAEEVQKGGRFHQDANGLIECIRERSGSIQQSFDAALLVNALMRISDHICNICEHVIFLVSGEDIRHQDIND